MSNGKHTFEVGLTKLRGSNAAAPDSIGGLAMIPIPSKVIRAFATGTMPRDSPRKKYARMVTKTGVVNEITVTSPISM